MAIYMGLKDRLLREFEENTGLAPQLTAEFEIALESVCSFLQGKKLRSREVRRRWLFARVNWKFRTNREPIAQLYAASAAVGVTFNYHQKAGIQAAFDLRDKKAFGKVLKNKGVAEAARVQLLGLFAPVSESETRRILRSEIRNPSKLRKQKGERHIDQEIILSCVAAFVFSSAEEQVLHEYFDCAYDAAEYEKSFWLQLRRMRPKLYTRSRTLDLVHVSSEGTGIQYDQTRQTYLALVRASYANLDNYGHLAVWIDPIACQGRDVTWELASDIMLFAEKHDLVRLERGYFRPGRIKMETLDGVTGLDVDAAQFELANEGFTYRDCYVCPSSTKARSNDASLLLVFQKNKRDEVVVPCPACRSYDVQGNSYPSLGVRSWECCNPLCPERSKYNRGKRYSFKALLTQEAIDDERNEIPVESVRSWMRDVQVGRNISEALKMLVSHYTLYGDVVHVFGVDGAASDVLGRRVVHHTVELRMSVKETFFEDNPWFHRYIVARSLDSKAEPGEASGEVGKIRVLQGNAFQILATFPPDSFDAAVTSPPYYNAREYAQWKNIYCYLRDMFGVARQVQRVLRPGSFYLYNIFDCFDNERSVVHSAMGDKRLVLSSYTVDLFRRAGFVLLGNVAWDKGDIEGRRGFNAGNFSPYYQSPFNCWEHVLVFWKPDNDVGAAVEKVGQLPSVLRAQPVTKMVRGENTYGHTAPFPEAIPQLLVSLLPADATVLDPFGGSATTGRALMSHARSVVCVEQNEEYCRLAVAKCSDPKARGLRGAIKEE
ncbi:hypothetical protein CMI37_20550 [Candidatus Pacearchaeota archaeon]|nr:hypothetical protein [Candidatus Pacearchaeota archaeon]